MGIGQDLKVFKAAWTIYAMIKEGNMNLQGYRTIITAIVGVFFSILGPKIGLTDMLSSIGITQDQIVGTLLFVAMVFLRLGVNSTAKKE